MAHGLMEKLGSRFGLGSPFRIEDVANKLIWHDPSDANTITHSSNELDAIDDKSGNAHHMSQTISGERPSVNVDTINGLNCITVDGSESIRTTTGSDDIAVTDFSCFVVAVTKTSPTHAGIATNLNGNSSTVGGFVMQMGTTQKKGALLSNRNAGTTDYLQDTTSPTVDQAYLLNINYDSSGSDLYIDKVLEDTSSFTINYDGVLSRRIRFGTFYFTSYGLALNGLIGEYLLVSPRCTDSVRAQINNFLFNKWIP